MILFTIILAIIIIFIFLLIFSTISIQIQYSHLQDSDCLKLKAKLWKKLTFYKVEIPVIKMDENNLALDFQEKNKSSIESKSKKEQLTPNKIEARIDKFKLLLSKINGFYQILNRFLKKVHVSNFKWHSEIGLGDAALTGVVTGFAWTLKGVIVGLIGNKMIYDNAPEISINPVFQMNHSQTNLSCMFSFKIGNAILVALQVVKHWNRRQ